MNMKKILGKIFSSYLLLHFLAMALFVALLCVGVKYGLDYYTHHGEGIVVPEVKGMTYSKARLLLEEDGLVILVSDSGYNKTLPPDYVLAQTPGYGMKVKRGHIVYVTVNAPSSPVFAIPDVVDNSSLREAEAKLMAMGFRLLPAQKVQGEKDWVYGIVCRGRRVSNGDRIPIDYPLTLLVGSGSITDMEDYEYVESSYSASENDLVDEFEEVKAPPVAY
ncbi:MAG: PASTA domain-containing protein [Prevotella sp.]|nr:PASTA domain-containing protein [Prevotella sp.]